MKRSVTLAVLLIIFFFEGCKKDTTTFVTSVSSNTFFDSAVQFLKSNLLKSDFNKLDVAKNAVLVYDNKNRVVQIFEKGSDNNKFLLLQSKNSNYTGNWVDKSGLTKISSNYASGTIILISFDHSAVTKLVVDSNEVTRAEKTSGNNLDVAVTYFNKRHSPAPYSGSLSDVAAPMLPEVVIYYDVNAGPNGAGIDYLSWYWLVDQTSAGSYAYFPSYGGGGSGSAGGTGNTGNVIFAPLTLSPDDPVTDLKQELKCFTNNSTSTYSISVNINEPDPGTREIVNPLSSFPVGHTFLTLEQHNADGTSITRTIGFYPKNSVKPGAEKDQSVFGDDSNTPYDVSLTFTVTGTQLNEVSGTLTDQQALQYDLDNFNCTNSAMAALKTININLPDTKSDEPLFNGNDPGDLGEDIRSLNLNTFSSQNGNVKVTRTVSNSDNQYPKARTGSCP